MILIIGASGKIGNHIWEYCVNHNIECLGTYSTHEMEGLYHYDLSDDLQAFLEERNAIEKAETAIICSAITDIDRCKLNRSESDNINVLCTEKVIRECIRLEIKPVFISSEAVFDGKKGMYKENDSVNPITVYGQQKLEVETFIRKSCKSYLVVRISRAISSKWNNQGILKDFNDKVSKGQPIICIKNQRFSLTDADDIAESVIRAINKNMTGIYHISNNSNISRAELAKLYLSQVLKTESMIIEKELNEFLFVDSRHILGGLDGSLLAEKIDKQYKSVADILEEINEK